MQVGSKLKKLKTNKGWQYYDPSYIVKCVYSKVDNHDNGVTICLYVDDIFIFSINLVQVQKTKELFSKSFQNEGHGGDRCDLRY